MPSPYSFHDTLVQFSANFKHSLIQWNMRVWNGLDSEWLSQFQIYYVQVKHYSARRNVIENKLFRQYVCYSYLYCLEDHLVGPVVFLQRKVASKIWLHQRSWFHRLQNLSIHLLLICLTLITDNSRLGSIIFEEFLLSTGTLRLHTCEVSIIDIGNVHLAHINFGRSGNYIGLVDSAKWNSIDFVWSGNEQKSRFQSLKAHNALAAETSTEEDAYSSGSKRGANTGGVVLLCPGVFWSGDVVGGVVTRRLAGGGGSLRGLLGTGNSENTLSVE